MNDIEIDPLGPHTVDEFTRDVTRLVRRVNQLKISKGQTQSTQAKRVRRFKKWGWENE
jgi:hypothetical protein